VRASQFRGEAERKVKEEMKEFESERSTRYCSLAVHQHRSEREEEKDRNGRGGICLVPGGGKIKRKGGRGGTWVVGEKRGKKKIIIIII
jgi:hypothetical protein